MSAGPMRVDYANRLIDKFEPGGQGIGFARISRADVVDGLRARVQDPVTQNQLAAGLCGPASLFYNILNDKPEVYVQYVIDLYTTGRARIGSMTIAPSAGCRAYKPVPTDIAPIDWIALGSLRDSENTLLDYTSVDDSAAAMTTPRTLANWFRHAGYSGVRDDTNYVFCKGRAELDICARDVLANRGVCLFINAQMLYDKSNKAGSILPDHWVVLEERPKIVGENVSLAVYSWGDHHKVPEHGTLSIEDFSKNFYGYVSATPRFD
jgi:hypothetical protein